MKTSICYSSIEILGDRIKGGLRWFEEPGEFFRTGYEGVKKASAVFNFITKVIWTGLIDLLVKAGWYILYRGLIIIGLMILFIGLKCSCNIMGQRMCSGRQNKCDELVDLEKLVDFKTKGYKRFRKRKKSNDRRPLL